MEPDPEKRFRQIRLAGAVGTIPLMLGVGPTVGFFAGRWLDARFGTTPWLQYIFLGLGFGAAARYTYRVVKDARKDMDRL
jgi:F0F1-type ATP synthase assembly protein I